MNSFELGDVMEIDCTDGVTFAGVLMFWNDDYLVLNGYGHLHENIVEARHG